MKKNFLRALDGETVSPAPIWLMRQAGRYLPEYMEIRKTVKNFLDFCYTPELAVEVTLQPLRRYGFDAAILFSDILVIPDALGQKVSFHPGEGPQLDPIRNIKSFEKLDIRGIHHHLSPVYEVLAQLSQRLTEDTALIGFCGAPWTVATYMVEGKGSKDFAETRSWAYRSPKEFSKLINLLIDATSAYLIEQVAHGAEALQIFDSWAGILPEREFCRWVIEPSIEIVKRVHNACPGVPIIGFPRGAGVLYRDFVMKTGVDAISLDSSIPLEWARDKLQPHCTVQGNMDNFLLVAGGEAMDIEAKRIVQTLGSGPFVFNLGHGIVPQTPPENVDRLVNVVRSIY